MKANALLQIIITLFFSITLANAAYAEGTTASKDFSYQLHADTLQPNTISGISCSQGSCRADLAADKPATAVKGKPAGEVGHSVRTASIDQLFILISSPFSPSIIVLVLFCLMSGLVFMFFGLRGF
jgi:hypothetical protein